jgi:hypothetical protein
MRNKVLESIYEKILLREFASSQSEEDKEFDILNKEDDVVDPLDETQEDDPNKAMKELVAAVQHLLYRYQNVLDGAKTEKSFMKEMQDLAPIIRATLNKISL